MKKILIIEDDEKTARFIEGALNQAGHAAKRLVDGNDATIAGCDLMILAVAQAEKLEALRAKSTAPILLLTARGSDAAKIAAFEKGANDYLQKPLFDKAELLERVRGLLRSNASTKPAAYECDGLSVDLSRRRVQLHEQKVHLSPTEYSLLEALIGTAGQVARQSDLLRRVWNKPRGEHDHYLRIYIQRLRQKLGDDPFRPRYIFTEPGIGYRMTGGR